MLILAGVTAPLLSGCGPPLCEQDVLKVVRDPRSDRYATVEVRNCGATTDYVTIVRVGRASEPQAEAEEVFVADADHGAARRGDGGTVWMNLVWARPGQLVIDYAAHARLFKRSRSAKMVTIAYRPSEPTG